MITAAFSGKPARGIKNKFIEEMEHYSDSLADYPTQNSLTQTIRKEAAKQNRPEFMSLWAGQGTRLSKEKPAGVLVKAITEQALQILSV